MQRRGRVVAGAEGGAPRSQRARDLIAYLTESVEPTFARLDAVDCSGLFDTLDITVAPQLPQAMAVPIQFEEPVRLTVWPDDEYAPSIYTTRDDFPLDLVHTSFDETGDGLCLCVWEENWADLKRGLTAQGLVERIRDWYARTARGELHQEGQSLEPLIPSSADTLILPAGPPPETCYVELVSEKAGRYTVILSAQPPRALCASFAVFALTVAPQVHGALHAAPTDLAELQALLEPMGTNVTKALGDWVVEQIKGDDRIILLIINIPKQSEADSEIEGWERKAFTLRFKLHELSEKLGRAARDPDGNFGAVLFAGDPPDLSGLKLDSWRIVQQLDRRAARLYAGTSAGSETKFVGIGAGAIGSNVMANAARAGLGPWTVIDNDVLLPHNLVRQAQTSDMIGWPKAESEQILLDTILPEAGNRGIVANVLHSGDQAEVVRQALVEADLVVDFSASPAALGYLADLEPVKRVASCFFNPDGSDLVVLAEDAERTLRIDEIEAQYFLAAGSVPRLAKHLGAARIDLVRYANACQDLTRPLPPWQVQTLGGIAAGQLGALLAAPNEPRARLWILNPTTGSVVPMAVLLAGVSRHAFDGLRVSISLSAVAAMRALREKAAPNETGGVLLGSYDLSRSVLHILDALPAPPDSRQTPTYFIRGAKDLKPRVDGINLRSAGAIHYVGEWHSHPAGAPARPSDDDEGVFAHLAAHLSATGTPYVMTICGDQDTWFRVGWQGRETSEGIVAYDAT